MAWNRALPEAAPEGPVVFDWEDETELKLQFAHYVNIRGEDWRQAGFDLFPGAENYGRAIQAAVWYSDIIVQTELKRLRLPENVDSDLPTKGELVRRLVRLGDDSNNATKDRIAAIEGAAKIMDYMPKPGPAAVVNNNVVNVLRVPERAQNKELFAERFKASQTKLVADARSKRE